MNEIILRTNKGEYTSGEDVFGVVYVNIEDPTAGRGVKLIFKGYEHFTYEYNSDGGKNKLEATKDYIDFYNVDLYDNQEPFALGSYSFPFKVTLPKVLPGTFHASSVSSVASVTWAGTVEYWLQACLTDSDLTADQSIVVQTSVGPEHQIVTTNVDHVIRRFPRYNGINFTVRLVEPSPVSGENLKLRMIITGTNTNITIHAFHIKLLRSLLLTCKKDVPSEKLCDNITRLQQRTYIQAEGGPLIVRETRGNTGGMNPAALTRVLDNILIPLSTREDGKAIPPCTKGHHIECKYGLEILVTLSNQSIVRINHPVTCVLHPPNHNWHSWVPPPWVAGGQIMISASRFSVASDRLSSEAFSGLPGFQAL